MNNIFFNIAVKDGELTRLPSEPSAVLTKAIKGERNTIIFYIPTTENLRGGYFTAYLKNMHIKILRHGSTCDENICIFLENEAVALWYLTFSSDANRERPKVNCILLIQSQRSTCKPFPDIITFNISLKRRLFNKVRYKLYV